jgi:protein-disulfide isomerase
MDHLPEPVSEQDHARGAATAPVTIVEYADFECPYSRRAAPIVRELERRYAEDIRVVFRHEPIEQKHPHARRAAAAAEAAGFQGKFWEMHDTLFEHPHALEDDDLVRYARALGLDVHRFVCDMNAETPHIHRSGKVPSVPAFFVNGKRFDAESPDVDTLARKIDELLEVSSARARRRRAH